MSLSGSAVVNLKPAFPSFPFNALLRQWSDARFEPEACRRELERFRP